jgi:hypothetical protein
VPVLAVDHTINEGPLFITYLAAFAEGTLLYAIVDGTTKLVPRRIPLPEWAEALDGVTVTDADEDDTLIVNRVQPGTPTHILSVRGTDDLAVAAKRAELLPGNQRRRILGLVFFVAQDAAPMLNGERDVSQHAVCATLGWGEQARCMCNWSPGAGHSDLLVVGTVARIEDGKRERGRLWFIRTQVRAGRVISATIAEVKELGSAGVRCIEELPDGALAVCHEEYLDVYQYEKQANG